MMLQSPPIVSDRAESVNKKGVGNRVLAKRSCVRIRRFRKLTDS